MKIVLAAGLYPPDIGGPATFAKQLEETLHVSGVEVIVVPFARVRCAGWRMPPIIRHIVYGFYVWRAARGAQYVVALDPVSVGLPALAAARLRFIPFVLRVGGDFAWEQSVQRFGVEGTLDEFVRNPTEAYPFRVQLMIYLQSLVARSAVHVVVPSEYLKRIVATWGVSEEKIVRIYSSAQVGELPTKEEARREFGFTTQKVIVSAGRFVPWKGFPGLIEAVAKLKGDFENILFCIVGSGPDETLIREHAVMLGQNVRFMGDMPKEKLLHLVRAADVFALNTNYEGLSHQLIEAMQARTPIVTTAIGGNYELLEDGVSGRLVPWGDVEALTTALQDILLDDSTTQKLIEAAYTKGMEFATDVSMHEWQNILHAKQCESPHVLMLSGDAHALTATSGVYGRMLLQAEQVARLNVFVRGARSTLPLGSRGSVVGCGESKIDAVITMLRKGLFLEHIDVVTAQDPFLLGAIAWYIAKKKGAVLQLQIHTNIFAPEFSEKHILKMRLARFLLARATVVRVVSDEIKHSLQAQCPHLSVTTLPIYIDTQAIQQAPVLHLDLEFPQFSNHIVVASRLESEKHVEDIITAMPDICKVLPEVGLLIAGEGSQRTFLEALATSLGVGGHVIFLGHRSDVYSLFKGASAVFAATAPYEGYGATAVEALIAGAPVVAVRDAGIVRVAGGTVVSKEYLAEEVVRLLQTNTRGLLTFAPPDASAWAQSWKKSLGCL